MNRIVLLRFFDYDYVHEHEHEHNARRTAAESIRGFRTIVCIHPLPRASGRLDDGAGVIYHLLVSQGLEDEE